ncbi:uncharacterized protein LOC106644103 [Copidosoma floridanum]|uniref:uncharacterized protein LOC106644103 n=1 Tax=Copidosoma floridanum TaxID=29053 RepID=UPI0006C950CC|nr:uncharacterized protein LOC106644103 [Copidosoma floridanum]
MRDEQQHQLSCSSRLERADGGGGAVHHHRLPELPPCRGRKKSEDDEARMSEAAVDSDGSISWEDFIGTTTDLVPQLLGMFDEIARAGVDKNCSSPTPRDLHRHALYSSADLKKQLSLVHQKQQQRRSRIVSTSYLDMAPAPEDVVTHRDEPNFGANELSSSSCCSESSPTILVEDKSSPRLGRNQHGSPTPLRYVGRWCRSQQNQQPGSRPVSGSSIASSTSSSGCSNQDGPGGHHHHATNPYLASVESLADTCASSQGSGDSGVVTISESSGGGGCSSVIGNGVGGNRPGGKIRLSDVDKATAARYFDERRPRYCDPHRTPVERVLLEIVDTEAVYVEHLRQVIQGYLVCWREDPSSLIRDCELGGLFSNIEDIFEFNRNFLSALDNNGLDPIRVANTFIEHNAGFEVYTEYCTNYPRTVSILTNLMGQEETARAFRERQAALGHDLPLGSFLLKPVQRILKYHLLLQNLSKEFEAHAVADDSSAEEGKAAIEGALKAMAGIATHINEMKRKHEHAVRVQEIQSLLYGWPGPDLTTGGELIAEGSFRMRGAKAPRHAFLFDRMLLLTKKREDGLLVYKAHILCSNLTLMESIPGEPLCFHVIPFDNSQIQYKLQARNLEQKREWTLQIKRVILENYNAVIPTHARQLVLQIGQNKSEEQSYAIDSDYHGRKSARERRRSETGLKQRLKKGRKSDVSTAENSPMCPRKNQPGEPSHYYSKDENLNRSSEVRGSKIKDRFTNWRRKSEPGFQSYIDLHASDPEENATDSLNGSATPTQELTSKDSETQTESEEAVEPTRTKENGCHENGDCKDKLEVQQRSVEEIVSNILMSQELQQRLEKQRNKICSHNGALKHNQRFTKSAAASIESSEEDDSDNDGKNGVDAGRSRPRFSRREQCFVRAVNAYNQRSFRSQYDSFRNLDVESLLLHAHHQHQHSSPTTRTSTRCTANERRSPPENMKKPNIVTESKVIKTALRLRENCDSEKEEPIYETPTIVKKNEEPAEDKNSKGNYGDLQHTWDGCLETDDRNVHDCPTKTAVWLTKLCEGLPDQPQKCGSLPRSFQMMNPTDASQLSKSRFLQRDGKSMTERPFTIASDKPAEINLEDMERYASSCQGSARIAKFPITGGSGANHGSSTSSSTFFCSLDDASFTDADTLSSRPASLSTSTHVHPDHKIYRANGTTSKETSNGTTSNLSSSSLRSVLSKAGSRLQGLRSSRSTEMLECSSEEVERVGYFRSFRQRNKNKQQTNKSISDVDEMVGCVSARSRFEPIPYHKQGSPSLGARIAQADYADPTILFSESRRNLAARESQAAAAAAAAEAKQAEEEEVFDIVEEGVEAHESDSFYERSFETIENYVDAESEEVFRDSAIFSDADDSSIKLNETVTAVSSTKVILPVPTKKKIKRNTVVVGEKPAITQKPAHLKLHARIVKCRGPRIVPKSTDATTMTDREKSNESEDTKKNDDVSAGQNQVGWVKRMVGQLQAQVDA